MPTSNEQRPDPDLLLAKVKRQEARGAARQAAHLFRLLGGRRQDLRDAGGGAQARSEGRDVVVGVVETHGRAETAALLEGLRDPAAEARCRIAARSSSEFDLDAALARRPALILVDELAHSNVPGARHPKRWQDVEELLAAGIDVFTTLNVQHLESLNDVVGGITNVRVWETVPDTAFDEADEVVLVDIPADELLARLKAGKVYVAAASGARGEQFLPQGQFDGAARAGAAPHGGSGRRRRSSVSRRQVDRVGVEDRQCAVDLCGSRTRRGAGGPRRGAPGGPVERRLACRVRGDPGSAAPARRRGARRFWER